MRALVAAGNKGLTRTRLGQIIQSYWKRERALKRLVMFEKARCEQVKIGRRRTREAWFALVADETMEHGLDPDWIIEVAGA
jgi:hypothetical protein